MNEKVEPAEHYEPSSRQEVVVAERKLDVRTNPRLAAVLESNKPNPWGKGYVELYGICFLIFLCSTMNGAIGDTTVTERGC